MVGLLDPDIRKDILAEISPTSEEIIQQKKAIDILSNSLSEFALSEGLTYSFIEPQGSTGGKQTQLKGTSDIDLFIALKSDDYTDILSLKPKERTLELNRRLEGFIESWFIPAFEKLKVSNLQKTYSQHPYLSLEFMKSAVDVLVCFDLSATQIAEEGPITAVDRTIHHTSYVMRKITDKLREDIRILKSFTRASHAYADACAVGQMGFTGYALELLVLTEKGLEGALETLRNLKEKPLDPLERPLKVLTQIPSFRDNIVFIIDPTDTNRNVASSFSERSYTWLRKRVVNLLAIPKEESLKFIEFIVESPIPTGPIPAALAAHSLAYEFQSDGSQHYTIVRDKLHRVVRKIVSFLENERTGEERFGRVLSEIYFEGNHFGVGLLIEKMRISDSFSRRGPPVDIPGSTLFKKSHGTTYEKDGYLWVNETRKWTNAKEMANHMFSKENMKGLTQQENITDTSRRVLNVLVRCILPIEPDFPLNAIV